jgi:hypothetical protein
MSTPSPFPCLRRLKDTIYNKSSAGLIVLFTAPKLGIVINNDDCRIKTHRVGRRADTWIRFDSAEDWEPVDCEETQVITLPKR